jgi:hypothetical protein
MKAVLYLVAVDLALPDVETLLGASHRRNYLLLKRSGDRDLMCMDLIFVQAS